MTDKLEADLAQGIEEDIGLKQMAQKLAPRHEGGGLMSQPMASNVYNTPRAAPQSVEMKLAEIERLVREIRATSAQVKGLLG